MAKKKIAELELSLLHLQQNIEIPEIFLSVHPVVQRAIAEVSTPDWPRILLLILPYSICPALTALFFRLVSVVRTISVSLSMRLSNPNFQTHRS